MGEVEFTLPAALDRPARRVQQTLYRTVVTLPCASWPTHPMTVTAILAREEPPPFDPEEWQAAWVVAHRTKPSETSPPLGQMVRLIAGFGGFLSRKHDGHPGPKAIWEGMQKVRGLPLTLPKRRDYYHGIYPVSVRPPFERRVDF